MRGPHNFFRLVRIAATFQRTGALRITLNAMQTHPNLKLFIRLFGIPFSILGLRGDPRLPPIARAITALGPAYIKFGQVLSTRPDIVGKKIASELKFLLDSLPPFPTDHSRSIMEQELGIEVNELFSQFSGAIATASIAQVHKAKIKYTDQEVAIKIRRPGIEREFQRDIDAFYLAAGIIRVLSPASRRLRPRAVIQHFEGVVNRELDFRLEAAAADEFAFTTSKDVGISVPRVKWEFSSKKVLVMQWAEGINLTDIKRLKNAGFDLEELSTRLIQLFLNQALRDGFFHADLHQGNLKVNSEGDLVFIDFGIMGRINSYTRKVYAEIIYGFINQNYHRVAEVHFEAGYVPPDKNLDDFAQALRAVGAPILDMDASHISMSNLLNHLFEVTERFGMKTRTELILLQRTMIVVEGVARSLHPKMNMWTASKPVVEDYIRDHLGPKAILKDTITAVKVLSKLPPQLPEIINNLTKSQDTETAPQNKSNYLHAFLFICLGATFMLLLILIYHYFQ